MRILTIAIAALLLHAQPALSQRLSESPIAARASRLATRRNDAAAGCAVHRALSFVAGAAGGALAGWFVVAVLAPGAGTSQEGTSSRLRTIFIGGGALLGIVLAANDPGPLYPERCRHRR